MNASKVTNTDDFVCWLSDDPDDWNCFSDYEQRIRSLVQEYNKMTVKANEPLLPILDDAPLHTIVRLSELNVSKLTHQELRMKTALTRIAVKTALAVNRTNWNL